MSIGLSIHLTRGLCAASALGAFAASSAAWAQTKTFDVRAQPAATGVAALARQADVQILISAADAEGQRVNSVRGAYPVAQALNLLLAGTGLIAHSTGQQTYTVTQFPKAEGGGQGRAAQDEVHQSAQVAELIVYGSRLPIELRSFPQTVSIVGHDEIEHQRQITSDVGEILSQTVPGLGITSNTIQNRDQTLRGRSPVVLIDGVPVSTPLRDGTSDIRTLSASLIDHIEVIRGSSSLYGNGGAGGTINYLTRTGVPGEFHYEFDVGSATSLTHPSRSDSPFVSLTALGGSGPATFAVAGSYEKVGLRFDADGAGLPPAPGGNNIGLEQSETTSLFAKGGVDTGLGQFSASVLFYEQRQKPTVSVRAGNVLAGRPATFVEGRDPRERADPGRENVVATLRYNRADVFGSEVSAQAYFTKYEGIYALDPRQPTPQNPSQSVITSEKLGARLDLVTPVPALNGVLLWGADLARDETKQPFLNGAVWMPPIELVSRAAYGQLSWALTERLTFRGGVRAEANTVDVPTYTTFRNVTGQGAKLEFSDVVFNAGATYDLSETWTAFGGFSEGTSVADIGRVLRDIRTNLDVADLDPKAVTVRSLEAGLRYGNGRIKAEVVVYRNTSKYGLQLVADPRDPGAFVAQQEDEEIFGVEAVASARLKDGLNLSVSAAYADGDRDADGDGDPETPLDNTRISPLKVTAALDWQATSRLRMRLQAVHSGSRDPFPGATGTEVIDEGRNTAYTVIDGSVAYRIGPGEVSLGVQNLLNEDYFTRYGQTRNRGDSYSMGPGSVVRLSYRVRR